MIERLILFGQRLVGNTWLGQALGRTGLVAWLRRGRDRGLLAAGVYEKAWAGRLVRFRVRTRTEIAQVDATWREQALITSIVDCLEPGDVFFDVGANIGVVSLLVADSTRDRGVSIHAFEPEPANFKALGENIAANELSNVTAHEIALGDTTGRTELHLHGEAGTGSHSLVRRGEPGSVARAVEVVRGDEIVDSLGAAPTVIKVDVEGAELAVLAGLENTLGAHRPRDVFLEIHPGLLPEGLGPRDVVARLEAAGYRSVWSEVRGEEIHAHYRCRPATPQDP